MCAITFLSSLGDQSSPSLSTSASVCNKVEPNLFHSVTKSNMGNILLYLRYFTHDRNNSKNIQRGTHSEASRELILYITPWGDLLRSVPHIKNDVKINLQEYIGHTG